MGLLENQVVAITGGGGGQGYAHALASAREGADVVLLDLAPADSDLYARAVAAVESFGRTAYVFQADVASQEALDAAAAAAVEAAGKVDAVIVNAGVTILGHFWEMPESVWDTTMRVNLTGAWKTAKAFMPHFIEREAGSFVMISSVDGIDPEEEITAYGVSKAGVLALMKQVAYEAAAFGVRCNAISPGFIDTPMNNTQEMYDRLAGGPGLGTRDHLLDFGHQFTALKGVSLLEGADVADTAIYLNSDLARNVTGINIVVDAGHSLMNRLNPKPVR
ncbi:SDR family oxidoreductase [Leucobacter musarum]|uniref:SDR family oxidoreductase n=1 Tax=Leucobacter musarum TaxID=1930747 RepID=UPI0006A7C6F4|nr:SDR family oxidoreductase [Leucobacter musarum]